MRKDEKFKAKEDAHNLKRRADPVYKERAIADTKKFLETNPDYKRNWDSEFYHRPFVIVDSERCRVKGAPPAIINGEADALGRMPAMGFLHDGRKPGRLSLVWDCIEPLRPGLVRAVFEFAGGRVFKKDDFAVFEGGTVRLKGQIIREITAVALAAASLRECVKVVRWLEGLL